MYGSRIGSRWMRCAMRCTSGNVARRVRAARRNRPPERVNVKCSAAAGIEHAWRSGRAGQGQQVIGVGLAGADELGERFRRWIAEEAGVGENAEVRVGGGDRFPVG